MSDLADELLATVREIRGYEMRLRILRSRRTVDTSSLEAELEERRAAAEQRLKRLQGRVSAREDSNLRPAD